MTATKSRLLTIDALRGVAAFLVVVYHIFGGVLIFQEKLNLPNLAGLNYLFFVPAFGYAGVYLFFVISGFCIHLRWTKLAAKGIENPQIDLWGFWKRRWLRLYPAYIAVMIGIFILNYYQGSLVLNAAFAYDVVMHVFMLHNLDLNTTYSINAVFWTLAIEEQLYLLYFILLMMRRRWGWNKTLLICFAIRFVWLGINVFMRKVTGLDIPFTESVLANWWIWALGAAAVENFYQRIDFPKWCYSLIVASLFLAAAAAMHYISYSLYPGTRLILAIVSEPLFLGAGFFIIINRAVRYEENIAGFIGSIVKVAAGVGLFSYSLYLTHILVIGIFPSMGALFLILACLIFAYIFFLIFEKPFIDYLAKQNKRLLMAKS